MILAGLQKGQLWKCAMPEKFFFSLVSLKNASIVGNG